MKKILVTGFAGFIGSTLVRQLRNRYLIAVSYTHLLISQQPVFLYLLVLHIIAFPAMITETMKDLSVIRENFKTEEDY